MIVHFPEPHQFFLIGCVFFKMKFSAIYGEDVFFSILNKQLGREKIMMIIPIQLFVFYDLLHVVYRILFLFADIETTFVHLRNAFGYNFIVNFLHRFGELFNFQAPLFNGTGGTWGLYSFDFIIINQLFLLYLVVTFLFYVNLLFLN